MRNLMMFLVFLAFLWFSPSGLAEEAAACPHALIDAVAWRYGLINIDGNAKYSPIVDEACKPWPYDRDLVLSALVYDGDMAYSGPAPTDAARGDVLDLYVSVFNRKTGKLVSTYTHKVYQDASVQVSSGSLSIDTARYDLAPGIRPSVSASIVPRTRAGQLKPGMTIILRCL